MNAKHVAPNHHTILNRIRQGILDLINQGGLTAQELNLIFELETRIEQRLIHTPDNLPQAPQPRPTTTNPPAPSTQLSNGSNSRQTTPAKNIRPGQGGIPPNTTKKDIYPNSAEELHRNLKRTQLIPRPKPP